MRWRSRRSRRVSWLRSARRAADASSSATLPLGRRRRSRPRTTCASSPPRPGCRTCWCAATWTRSAACSTAIESVLAGPDARARPLACSTAGWARSGGHAVSFFPRCRHAGRRAAEQLAGRALAVGAGHRAQDAARAQAGQRGAVDAVPDDPGVHRGRRARRGVQLLPHRPRGRRRDPAPLRTRHGVRRRGLDAAVAGDPRVEVHGPGYSKVLLGEDAAERLGSSIST